MAVRINLDHLTSQQKKTIKTKLFMQPKQKGFFKNKRFVSAKDPILLYTLDKPNNEIIIPYTFGNSLMGYHINSVKEYPHCNFDVFNFNPRPHQGSILQEAREQLKTKGTTILGVFPGGGKSLMSTVLCSELKGLTLIVVPIKLVLKGWNTTFKEYTNAKVWVVENTKYNKTPPEELNVILTMDTMFYLIPAEILAMVKILVVDEAHKFCSPSRINCLISTCPQYVIMCTATLERSDGLHSIIHAITGKHGVFRKTEKRFTVYKFETGIKTEVEKTKRGDPDWAKLVIDLAFDVKRNAMIIDMVEKNISNHKIMILTWSVDHAYFLCKLLQERGNSCDVLVGQKSDYKDSNILVAGIGKAGCGFDEASACPDWGGERSNLMLLTGSTRSLQLLEQVIGRVFRSDFPTIIDFVDDNYISKSHWRSRIELYEDPDTNGEILYVYANLKEDNVFTEDIDIQKIEQETNLLSIHSQRLLKLQENKKKTR